MYSYSNCSHPMNNKCLTSAIAFLCLILAQNLSANNGFDCIVTPSKITDVTAATSGRLASVLIDRSDEVVTGQVLAELDAEVERAALAVADARASMTSEVQLAKISYSFGNQRKERLESLNISKVASNQDLDDATRDAALAAWNVQQAKDVHELRKLEKIRAEALLRQKTVTSPVTGVVLERFKNKGEFVEDQAIVRIAQLDPLYVETIVPITLFGKIERGSAASLSLPNKTDEKLTAVVNAVDRTADAAAGTFGVRLEIPNPEGEIPAGVKCSVVFDTSVPAQASKGFVPAAEQESFAALSAAE